MKFTIFTGFYNYLDTFEQLVKSILNQTHTDWEWLVSDDFSENPEVLFRLRELEMRSDKIKLIPQTKKKEFYFDPPIKHSTGDVFIVIDSDDLPHENLLEVYAHHFEMFPDVQMISTNSILRQNDINGPVRATRYINYREAKNTREAMNDSSFEYNWGDCRAWRNKIDSFDPENKWQYCAEDLLKVLKNEELGKILFLPRVLHTYAWREDSISHETSNGYLLDEDTLMKVEAEERVTRENLDSVHKYYDDIFYFTTPFYLSSLNREKNNCDIEVFIPTVTEVAKKRLQNLYLDHELFFYDILRPDYFIARIKDKRELELLGERLTRGFAITPKELVIEADKELSDDVLKMFNKFSGGWYFTYVNFTFILKMGL